MIASHLTDVPNMRVCALCEKRAGRRWYVGIMPVLGKGDKAIAAATAAASEANKAAAADSDSDRVLNRDAPNGRSEASISASRWSPMLEW